MASKTRREHTHRHACIRLGSLEMPGGWRGSLSIHSQTPARLSSPICPLSLYRLPPSQPQHTHMASKQTIHTRHASRTDHLHNRMTHTSQNSTQNFCAQQVLTPTHLTEKTILDRIHFHSIRTKHDAAWLQTTFLCWGKTLNSNNYIDICYISNIIFKKMETVPFYLDWF